MECFEGETGCEGGEISTKYEVRGTRYEVRGTRIQAINSGRFQPPVVHKLRQERTLNFFDWGVIFFVYYGENLVW